MTKNRRPAIPDAVQQPADALAHHQAPGRAIRDERPTANPACQAVWYLLRRQLNRSLLGLIANSLTIAIAFGLALSWIPFFFFDWFGSGDYTGYAVSPSSTGQCSRWSWVVWREPCLGQYRVDCFFACVGHSPGQRCCAFRTTRFSTSSLS